MSNHINFGCLGLPVLLDSLGDPVAIRTRKAAAIVGYLSRVPGMSIGREALADLLWSDAPRLKAMQSLRQALKQVREAERMAGEQLLISRSGHVSLDPSKFRSDLDKVMALVKSGRGSDFKQATELWRGDLFLGCDDLDPVFSDWLGVERERIRTEVFSASFQHLNGKAENDGGERLEAGAGFLLHIDPACEPAHQVLIRLYMSLGQRERAQQQLQACARELRAALDAEPDEETKALLQDSGAVSPNEIVNLRSAPAGHIHTGLAAGADEIRLPRISVMSGLLQNPHQGDARSLKDEIIAGLSSFRSFELFNETDGGDERFRSVALIGDRELGHYLLRFNFDERTAKIAIQFEDRINGQIVFNEIIDLTTWESLPAAASQTVNRIHSFVIGRLCQPSNSSAFGMWCQADSLLWQFSPSSDLKAMRILDELVNKYSSFSMAYAGKAAIIMKQELYYPASDRTTFSEPGKVVNMAERAVTLDPWQAVNQRVYGWAMIQSNSRESAKKAFQTAGRLGSVDPANLMSVAEGLAFSGDILEAKKAAERAFALFSFVPRVFYEYLASICFAAGEYDDAVIQLERAAGTSVLGLTTRVAALVSAGKKQEALAVLKRNCDARFDYLREMLRAQSAPGDWRRRINCFQEANARANFDSGATIVENYLFNRT